MERRRSAEYHFGEFPESNILFDDMIGFNCYR